MMQKVGGDAGVVDLPADRPSGLNQTDEGLQAAVVVT
jgi:hypothetical protein